MTEALFEQVKRKLNITWEDDETTNRVTDIVKSAIPDVIDMLGITDRDFDFSIEGAENTLFLAYCLYEFNHALNEFENNYAKMIAKVRAKYEVEQYLESEETESEQT